jgi:hypothetical protein
MFKIPAIFRRDESPAALSTGLAFCERVTATATSPKHIRKLSERGLITGGGADTPALCGAVVAWDTTAVTSLFDLERIQANAHDTYRICQQCLPAARLLLEDHPQ